MKKNIVVLRLESETEERAYGIKQDLSYVAVYEKILQKNNIPYEIIRYGAEDFWKKALSATHFIARFKGFEPDLSIGHAILPLLEDAGVRCMPDYNSFQFCGDKLRLAAFYSAKNIPSPQTIPVFSSADVDRWKKEVGIYPVVGKLRKGASSANVVLIQDADQLDRISTRLFEHNMVDGQMDPSSRDQLVSAFKRRPVVTDQCLLLQEFAEGNDGDHRIITIGRRAFYYRRSNRPNDFRASGSGILSHEIDRTDPELTQLALALSQRFRFPMMVYDFLSKPRPMLTEMNYATVGKYVSDCPGYFTPDGDFEPHDNRPPQWYQLADFLERPDLQIP